MKPAIEAKPVELTKEERLKRLREVIDRHAVPKDGLVRVTPLRRADLEIQAERWSLDVEAFDVQAFDDWIMLLPPVQTTSSKRTRTVTAGVPQVPRKLRDPAPEQKPVDPPPAPAIEEKPRPKTRVQYVTPPTSRRYLSAKEVAAELGVHEGTIARYISKGQLPVIRLPSTTNSGKRGVVRIDREDIDRLMQAHKTVCGAPIADDDELDEGGAR